MTPRSAYLGALGLLLLPVLCAWRPYETIDGTTTPPGLIAAEWGVATLEVRGPLLTLAAPQLLVRLGASDRVEVGVRGVYRDTFLRGQAPWQGGTAAGDVGVYGKWVVIAGGMQNPRWARPSVALLGGVQFLTEQSLWALDARAAGSVQIGPVLLHANIGFHEDRGRGVIAGAVASVPLAHGLTPAAEVSGEVRFGEPSRASVLLGLVYPIPGVPITADLAARRGMTPGTPDWMVLGGLTLQLRVFQPRE